MFSLRGAVLLCVLAGLRDGKASFYPLLQVDPLQEVQGGPQQGVHPACAWEILLLWVGMRSAATLTELYLQALSMPKRKAILQHQHSENSGSQQATLNTQPLAHVFGVGGGSSNNKTSDSPFLDCDQSANQAAWACKGKASEGIDPKDCTVKTRVSPSIRLCSAGRNRRVCFGMLIPPDGPRR